MSIHTAVAVALIAQRNTEVCFDEPAGLTLRQALHTTSRSISTSRRVEVTAYIEVMYFGIALANATMTFRTLNSIQEREI